MSKTTSKRTVTSQSTESVVTRYKSAQQGRQLRKIDRSMKSITRLLKSPSQKSSNVAGPLQKTPVKDKNSTVKKSNGSRKSSPNKKVATASANALNTKESLSNITKKSGSSQKKITLKPKYDMKVIAKTNKRKLNTPHRGLISPPPFTKTDVDRNSSDKEVYRSTSGVSFDSELTMADVVRLAEEADCLDDEDLMEILTCPSPVWWEDPPDHNYVEDPIIMRIPTNVTTDKDAHIQSEITDKNINRNNNKDIVVRVNDKRIIEKRNKLEKILGNIKNKFANNDNINDITKRINKNKRKIKEISNDNEFNKLKTNSDGNEYDLRLSDISVNGDELLRELECMDIPIGVGDVKDVDNNLNNKQSNDNNSSNSIFKIKLIDKFKKDNERTTLDSNGTNDKIKTMPMLKEYPVHKSKTEQSKSPLNVTEDGSTSNSYDANENCSDETEDDIAETADAIDSDIKMRNDKINGDSSVKDTEFFHDGDKNKLVTVSKDTESISNFESYIDKSDFITVYKIMTQKYINNDVNKGRNKNPINNNKHNKREIIKSKIRGDDNMKSNDIMEINDKRGACCDFCKRKSFIPIPDSNKRLCLRCSSVYEECCTFCAKKDERNEEVCTCEFSARNHSNVYHRNAIASSPLNKSFTVIKDN